MDTPQQITPPLTEQQARQYIHDLQHSSTLTCFARTYVLHSHNHIIYKRLNTESNVIRYHITTVTNNTIEHTRSHSSLADAIAELAARILS